MALSRFSLVYIALSAVLVVSAIAVHASADVDQTGAGVSTYLLQETP